MEYFTEYLRYKRAENKAFIETCGSNLGREYEPCNTVQLPDGKLNSYTFYAEGVLERADKEYMLTNNAEFNLRLMLKLSKAVAWIKVDEERIKEHCTKNERMSKNDKEVIESAFSRHIDMFIYDEKNRRN